MSKNIIKQPQEIPKYLKSTGSNISKSNRKSKHRHHYEECLIQYRLPRCEHITTRLRSYCIICGKIGDRFKEDKSIIKDYKKTINTHLGKYHPLISGEELYEKYHDKISVFFVKDIFKNKCVDLEQNHNSKGE